MTERSTTETEKPSPHDRPRPYILGLFALTMTLVALTAALLAKHDAARYVEPDLSPAVKEYRSRHAEATKRRVAECRTVRAAIDAAPDRLAYDKALFRYHELACEVFLKANHLDVDR